jgi:hypothetical protein
MDSGALLSECERYRFRLWRSWGSGLRCCFVDGIEVVNLFALRATTPTALRTADEPVGFRNDEYILEHSMSAGRVVIAWGNHGSHLGRGASVRGMLTAYGVDLHAFGLTRQGEPLHPLYLPKSQEPRSARELWAQPYVARRAGEE